ncbi:DedA family protein/thiosulfate sulfurtransferase GlpE [Trinickia sp. Y13]|uniref:DedA family protein/thiosulfate sulfurtransferase GlpE n=1 Tax=Trinickia sp. Y13 TaxID=2917807 RepID=UPI0024049D8E|nr:DedA family protein/thiosulfate sulfurtransferase GlpE [Trinickia sp. Y13]MDG0024849.1 DedA family protein/thiosulfate sulfurtransferase GlpE [Trinickia sp. Y13]
MLHDLVARYGPGLVFVNALAASLGLPVPAMPTLIAFGAMAALHPASIGAQLLPVLVLAVFASVAGDSVWFFAGRYYGGATLKTLCRLSLSRDTCVKKTERFFGRWGVRVLTVSKLVPGLSLLSVPMAGAVGVPFRAFVAHDGIGAAIWATLGLAVGVMVSRQVDWLLGAFNRLGPRSLFVVAALLAAYAGYRWLRRRALNAKLVDARIAEDELHALMSGEPAPVVLDIRSDEKRQLEPYVIPGAQLADERRLDEIIAAYRPDQKVVIYCSCPNEVSAAWMAKKLIEAGFHDVLPLKGGIDAWRDAGRAVASLPLRAEDEGRAEGHSPPRAA